MARKILNGLDLVGQRIVNVGDPSAAGDVVNLQTLQNYARGLSAIKEAVRVASTANITLSSPGATIDGVSMAVGNRLLLKNQTSPSENGIWVWAGAAVGLSRASDADGGSELAPGTSVYVTEGSANGDKAFVITSDAAITVGATAQTWTQFGGGTSYTASNGVQLVGNDYRAVAAPGGGLTVGVSGLSVDFSTVCRKVSANLGNGSLTVITVNHGLGTLDVHVSLRQTADNAIVDADVVATDTNNVTFTFATAPGVAALRATIMG